MQITDRERRVVSAIADAQDELIELAGTLISFDTTARDEGGGPRQEHTLQVHLSRRLREHGAETDMWEPTPEEFQGSRQVPPDLSFVGYPQLLARFPGVGGGGTLLLNGHIDAVSAEPQHLWASNPWQPQLRDGHLYGRGAVDMKGGVAAISFAAEMLRRCDVRLRGDLVVPTVTDEESTSAGGVAIVNRGVRADAAIVAEPTGLNIGVACRGSLLPTVVVPGRAGHATATQPHWEEGGAVSAAGKAGIVLDAVTRLRQVWRDRPDQRDPLLPPSNVVVTKIDGGQWIVSYADSCRIRCHISYQPTLADANGYGTDAEREFTAWVQAYTQTDPWLAANPPAVEWSTDVPPAAVHMDHPIVQTLSQSACSLNCQADVFGADFWHDGATFTRSGIPAVVFGPGQLQVAHAVDEYVPVEDLVRAAQTLAVTAMRFCGTE